jgi:excisionase family DNA binding protein
MAKGKNVLTTGDVARICNVAPRTVSKWFDEGQIKGYKIPGSKDRRIPISELSRFMKANNMPPVALPVGQLRILICDNDNDASASLFKNLKAKTDYEIHIVHGNFETGMAAQKFAPHILLINIAAKAIDNKDICKNIRTDKDLSTIKIIALANKLSSSESAALLQKGFNRCITGWSDTAEVIKVIEEETTIIY